MTKKIKIFLLIFICIFSIEGVFGYSEQQLKSANFLAKKEIINNYSDNIEKYRLDDFLLRQEMAAIVMGINKEKNLRQNNSCKGYFSDVSDYVPNNWACHVIEPLVDIGVVTKNDKFRPEDSLTNIEALGFLMSSVFGEKYDGIHWGDSIYNFAMEKGIISKPFSYNEKATRGFVFEIAMNALNFKETENLIKENNSNENNGEKVVYNDEISKELLCELMGICETEKNTNTQEETVGIYDNWVTPGIGVGSGNSSIIVKNELEVSINSFSPGNQTIPGSGVILFGKLDFTARGQDVTLKSILLRREGLGSRNDIKRVFLEKNGIRLTLRSGVSYDDKIELIFSPEYVIKQGSTETFDIMVELSDNVGYGNENRFAIRSANDIEASSNVIGNFPLQTGTMGSSTYTTGKVNITPINISGSYFIGQINATMAEFRIDYSGDNDIVFKSLKMRNMGDAKAETSLDNIKLYRDGKEVSYQVNVDGRDVNMTVYDTIKSNGSAVYQLKANIIKWDKNGEEYQFEIRNGSDVSILEENTGFSLNVNILR